MRAVALLASPFPKCPISGAGVCASETFLTSRTSTLVPGAKVTLGAGHRATQCVELRMSVRWPPRARSARQGVPLISHHSGGHHSGDVAEGLGRCRQASRRYARLPVSLTASFLVPLPTEAMVSNRVTFEPTAALDLTVTLAVMRYVAAGASDGV